MYFLELVLIEQNRKMYLEVRNRFRVSAQEQELGLDSIRFNRDSVPTDLGVLPDQNVVSADEAGTPAATG
jgi:hypothetical protein